MSKVIAVNTRILVKDKLEGIGNFTHEIFQRLVKQHPDCIFHFIFNYSFDQSFVYGNNVVTHILQPPAKHPLLVKVWYDVSLALLLKKIKPDLFISPDAITSLTTKTKMLTVMHDIGFAHRPQDLPKSWAWFYNKYSKQFAEKSTRIATVSEYSKNDISTTYGIAHEKIDVVYNGLKNAFLQSNRTMANVKAAPIQQPYFFYIGSLHPRKNILNLLRGFEMFKTKNNTDTKLVIGGDFLFKSPTIESVLKNCTSKDDIVFTGRLSDTDLINYLSHALALTYIPFFEGFGIPLLEAMACETPILTSNLTALPEIAKDAAYYVNPHSVHEIAAGMGKIALDVALRENITAKGRERLKDFSWDKSAALLWESIQKTIAQ